MYEAPWYGWLMVLVAVFALLGSVALVVYRGGLADQVSRRSALRTTVGVLSLLVVWVGVVWIWADSSAGNEGPDQGGLRVGISFTVILIALLVGTRLPSVSRSLNSPGSLIRLTLPHTIRVFGVIFLIVMAQGSLPAIFALPAGLGDIAVGVSAPFVARSVMRGDGQRRALWFNVLGLADLVVAVGIGLLAGAAAWSPIDVSPTTAALSSLPLVLVPLVAVPLAVTLHVTSLRQLRQTRSPGERAMQSAYEMGG